MIQLSKIQDAINTFSIKLNNPFHLKGIFFDMDGVLFNSMHLHSKAWLQVFEENGFPIPEFEPYLNEGCTALYTVKKMYKKYRNLEISEEFAEKFKTRKHELMNTFPDPETLPGMPGFLKSISGNEIECWVVTGSAQNGLIDRLEKEFPGSLLRDKMVTAMDVQNGKPYPEPYLKALAKSGFNISEAIVIENAPMGVLSAKAAGLFTIAINTGPIDPEILSDAGADLVFSGCEELIKIWPSIESFLKTY
jgi:beta-phosphoglucomutase-like phosphatase (HAD superfamily)